MQEVWKAVSGFESLYEVSNLGRVRSLDRVVNNRWGTMAGRLVPGKIRAFSSNSHGYQSVHLHVLKKTSKFYVHRLVAQAFIDNPLDLPQVNHKNGDKACNGVENLEWLSGSENCMHALRTGLYQVARGENAGHAVLTDSKVLEIRRLAATGMYHKDIALEFGVGRKAITKIVNRQRWSHLP